MREIANKGSDATKQNGSYQSGTNRKNTTIHHVRYFIIFIGGMTCGAMFFTRLAINIAMIRMVNHTYLNENNPDYEQDRAEHAETGEFNWPNVVQQFLISGYMIAYVLPQVFTTRLAIKYGVRLTIPIGLSVSGISCILTPPLAQYGWGWVLALRLINGVGASCILPTTIGLVESWMPYKSSAAGLSLLQFVQTILYTCTPLFSGYLAAIHWKWAFYAPGATALFFSLVWILVVRNEPDECSYISQKELNIIKGIEECQEDKEMGVIGQENIKKAPRTDLPWYFMFKVKSFYFFVIIWFSYCSTFSGFLNLLPAYFNRALNTTIEENGFYNFIIQVGVLGSMLWSNPIIAFLQNRYDISLTNARKLIVFTYTSISILTWTYIALYHENQLIAICINRFFHMTNDTVITATLMSQYGKYGLSSTVFSMMNSLGNPGSTLFSSVAGRFLDNYGESLECWSWIFHVMSMINVVVFLIYYFFLDSDPVLIPEPESNRNGKEIESAYKV